MADWIPWGGMFLLGAYHGLNPAMGWLFALALGLQERRRWALLQALGSMALGHLLAVGLTAVPLLVLQVVLPLPLLRGMTAAILAAFGVYRLARAWHPRWVGMRVGFRDLIAWSALMASGHGAGLMLSPFLMGPLCIVSGGHGSVGLYPVGILVLRNGLGGVGAHTLGYVLTAGLIAWLIYEGGHLAFLRQAWINLDLLWALALIGAALMMPFL
ncbi:hypothetical protein [Thermoflexus sp.]|uniref:hypothetical protein n=1 Tax=Thermoflexus sp. TaxID=1969742 RepID=UPI0035E429C9